VGNVLASRAAPGEPWPIADTAAAPLHALGDETLITIPAAAKLLPPRGAAKGVNPSTPWRWCRKGVRVAGGGRLKLESVQIGAVTYTSRDALRRFLDRLAAARAGDVESAATRSDAARERAAAASGRRLEAAGI
jgi:hypothetical protein